MTLTVRLDPSLESSFARVCELHGVTKSQVVAQAIRDYVERDSASQPTLHPRFGASLYSDSSTAS